MLQVGLFHVITDENEIIAVIDANRVFVTGVGRGGGAARALSQVSNARAL